MKIFNVINPQDWLFTGLAFYVLLMPYSFAQGTKVLPKKNFTRKVASQLDGARSIFQAFLSCGKLEISEKNEERLRKCMRGQLTKETGASQITTYEYLFLAKVAPTIGAIYECDAHHSDLVRAFEREVVPQFYCFDFVQNGLKKIGTVFFEKEGPDSLKISKIKL